MEQLMWTLPMTLIDVVSLFVAAASRVVQETSSRGDPLMMMKLGVRFSVWACSSKRSFRQKLRH